MGAASGGGAEGGGVSVEGPLWPTSLRERGALTGCIEGVYVCAVRHVARGVTGTACEGLPMSIYTA